MRLFVLLPAGAWAAFNGFVYAADLSKRYRAESAWFIFAAVLIIAALQAMTRGPRDTAPQNGLSLRLGSAGLLVFLFLGAALYFPILSIGLLSDDFVLIARAQAGVIVDTDWDYLRPFPLAIWSGLSRLHGLREWVALPVVLHALNIGLHGVNAWLTGALAIRFGLPARTALLAALAFLVLPTSVEPVAWASGVFDVLLVTLILAACLALTTRHLSGPNTILVLVLSAGALITKETAVVIPALLAVAAFCSPHVTLRRTMWPIALSAGLVVLYISIRLIAGFAAAPASTNLSGYTLKEIVSRPFGSLGLPFHVELIASNPWIPFAFAASWPALLVWSAVRWPRHQADARHVLGLAAWIGVSVIPIATMLFVADDLQGARYLYLGSVAWSIMIAVLLGSCPPTLRPWIIAPVIVLFAIATREQQSSWTAAALERDRVLAAYRQSGLSCAPEDVRGLPDHVRGAYVFRNGFAEALTTEAPSADARVPCVLEWDGDRFSEVRR